MYTGTYDGSSGSIANRKGEREKERARRSSREYVFHEFGERNL